MSECSLCDSLKFYLDLLRVNLDHNRYDAVVRTAMDNIAAILNGYVSKSQNKTFVSGNWKKFKHNCYTTIQAKDAKDSVQKPHMEHVVPISVIWEKISSASDKSDLALLVYIYKYVAPCLITKKQQQVLDQKFKTRMGHENGDLRNPDFFWSRYKLTEITLDNKPMSLLSQVQRVNTSESPPLTADQYCKCQDDCLMKRFNSEKNGASWADQNKMLKFVQANPNQSR